MSDFHLPLTLLPAHSILIGQRVKGTAPVGALLREQETEPRALGPGRGCRVSGGGAGMEPCPFSYTHLSVFPMSCLRISSERSLCACSALGGGYLVYCPEKIIWQVEALSLM